MPLGRFSELNNWQVFAFGRALASSYLDASLTLVSLITLTTLSFEHIPFSPIRAVLNADFSELDEAIRQFSQKLTEHRNITILDLNNCTGLTELPESLGKLKQLIVLDLRNCTGLTKLPKSLGQLKDLRKLVLVNRTGLRNDPTIIELQKKEKCPKLVGF